MSVINLDRESVRRNQERRAVKAAIERIRTEYTKGTGIVPEVGTYLDMLAAIEKNLDASAEPVLMLSGALGTITGLLGQVFGAMHLNDAAQRDNLFEQVVGRATASYAINVRDARQKMLAENQAKAT